MNLTRITNSLKPRTLISGMSRGDALLPIILLEMCVTTGRTYQAYKRGGFVESRERGTEETLGALFWIGGVPAFNHLGDCVGKKLLNVDKIEFDVGKDAIRKPFENYLHKTTKLTAKQLSIFKFTKIAASILLSNSLIGFVVPKINQAITTRYQNSIKTIENPQNSDKFERKDSNKNQNTPNFSGSGVQTLLSITNNFENDARYKLLSSDAGIAGGRAINARNKYERRESLFRDLGSIYFYMFCKNHIASILNYIQDGRTSRLDPTSAQILDNNLKEKIKGNSMSAEEFEKIAMGNPSATIPEEVQKGIKNGIITLDEFEKLSQNKTLYEIAQKMSELQPPVKGVKILSAEQVKDVYTGGLVNNPEMLQEIFTKYSGGKSINPMAYYPENDLRKLKSRMHDYINDIIKKAKATGENIDVNALTKASRANLVKNAFNLTTGLAISAYFLSTVIPKVQYWITRKTTGQDNFPGVQKYNK